MTTSAAPDQKIRIIIVEDHVLVRMGLVAAANNAPDIKVVAEVDDGRQVVNAFRAHPADVIVLDLRMPEVDGVEVIAALRKEFNKVRVLILSSYSGGDDVMRAMKAGAAGYVAKGMPLSRLLEGIRTVHSGKQYLPEELSNRMNRQMDSDISGRELEVLRLIAHGKSNKEIATELGIVEVTVKAHLGNIFRKLGAVDRAQAMAIAVKRQLIEL